MKYLWYIYLMAMGMTLWVCMGCKSHHDTVVETRIERDTVYQASVKYDSVYLERMVDIDRTRDTILIREKETKTKYRLIHDSIYITRVDSIPYTIEVEKRENIPKWQGWLNRLGYASLVLVIVYVWRRLTSR